MDLHEYILKNWKHTIRDPKDAKDENLSFLKIPNKYTTPCADGIFQNFYYWDTYFTNVGLLADDLVDVARDNLRVMKTFIARLGYVPNADHLIFGSQPPFFTRGIYDLYQKTNDISVIEEFLNSACVEMEFWKFDRNTPCGLNQWGCGWTKVKCDATWSYVNERTGGLTEQEKKIDKIKVSQGFYAIAESGWDINIRYKRKGFRFDSLSFASIDLNAILYDAEVKIAEMAKIIKNDELCNEFLRRSSQRKALMEKLMKDKKSGIFYDYCFKDKRISKFLTAASLYPYAFGLSSDKESAKEIFNRLDFEYGLSTCEYRGEDQYLQWDYPHMWPPIVLLAYIGLRNVGLIEEANKLKKQYMSTLEKNYEATGKLWEKYNSVTGEVSKTVEYETPTMMGWTAGVYEYLLKN